MRTPGTNTALITILALSCATAMAAPKNNSPSDGGVRITELKDRLRVEINGHLFTEYIFRDTPRPYFYPLIGPGNVHLTRNFPMKDTPDEDHDHPHHRSLWFAHGDVNGKDFWTERKGSGTIVHDGFTAVKASKDAGVISCKNKWIDADGKQVCDDERTMTIYTPTAADERMIDFDITLHASDGDLTFGDTKEGTMAVRVAETMKLKAKGPPGHIVNSEGIRDDETWGKRASWCDYSGLAEGKMVGIAMFDHPKNPQHPTWWHVRDYGLFAANPFGKHDFEKLKEKTAGNFTIAAGKSATFRYRFYLHPGAFEQARVAEKYDDYVKKR